MKEYIPETIDLSDIKLPDNIMELAEVISKNVHEVWSRKRLEEGWVYGEERSDSKKTNPCLVPYEELPEIEKAYDRDTALETLKLIIKLGYRLEKDK